MAKVGVDNKARPMRVGEVDNNVDGVIQQRVDAVVLGEPRGDVFISVRTCG